MIDTTRQLHELIVGRITFPLTNALYNRRRVMSTYRQLLATETMPPERLRELQLDKLRKVLFFADRWVPFYRERFAQAGLVPEDVRSLSDLSAIPPLTREDLVEQLPRLIDRRQRAAFQRAVKTDRRGQPIPFAPFRRNRLVRNTTSGSTGTPAVTFEDGSTSALSWATELRCKQWFGVGPGAREARLKRVANEETPPWLQVKMRQYLWNQLPLPGLNLVEADHRENLSRISRFQPQVLWGCTTTLVRMAEFVQQRGQRLPFYPKLIITWSEPLLVHEKALLEETFQCPAANIYGGREVGHLGATCPEGVLHSNQESFFLDTGRPYSEDCPGELMVTTLFETPLPLIRYQMGDLAELGSQTCSCGRTLQTIRRLSGRSVERFVTSEGRTISGVLWPQVFAKDPGCLGVRRFQTVYRPDGGLCFRIVRGGRYSSKTEDFVRDYVHKNIQADLRVVFEFPDEIPVGPSGKFPLLVDERRDRDEDLCV